MDIREERLRRMNELIAYQFGGSASAFARQIGRSASQVNQWQSGTRTISEDSARLIEARTGKPSGWLDATANIGNFVAEPRAEYVVARTPQQKILLKLFDGLTSDQKNAALEELEEKARQNEAIVRELSQR